MFYICINCGYGSASWLGKCPECGQWNTMEQKIEQSGKKEAVKKINIVKLQKVTPTFEKNRIKTGLFEFNRVLGGGLIQGEVAFLSGEPGIGKSTLLLQAVKNLKTLYISGEEAANQVKMRAERLGVNQENFYFSEDLQVEGIIESISTLKNKPEILIIDSIQTVYSKDVDAIPGSITQTKESTSRLISFAKKTEIPVIIVGHITKEGDIAGPKTLEHLVDCVLVFEGENNSNFRILRSSKNRFGPTDEIGIFEMKENGLNEISNPLVFLEGNDKGLSAGKATIGIIEGKRPLFFEIESLVVPTILTIPRRVANGVDYNKVLLLLAVIKKHLRLPLDKYDIYVNVIGGVKIKSTTADLGIIASLVSSIKNAIIPHKTVFIGEVGLLGEVRKVYYQEKVIGEAKRLGFKKIISSEVYKYIKEINLF